MQDKVRTRKSSAVRSKQSVAVAQQEEDQVRPSTTSESILTEEKSEESIKQNIARVESTADLPTEIPKAGEPEKSREPAKLEHNLNTTEVLVPTIEEPTSAPEVAKPR